MQGAKFKVWITTQEYIIMTCLWILSLGTIDSTNCVWCSLKFGDNCDGFDLYIYCFKNEKLYFVFFYRTQNEKCLLPQ